MVGGMGARRRICPAMVRRGGLELNSTGAHGPGAEWSRDCRSPVQVGVATVSNRHTRRSVRDRSRAAGAVRALGCCRPLR